MAKHTPFNWQRHLQKLREIHRVFLGPKRDAVAGADRLHLIRPDGDAHADVPEEWRRVRSQLTNLYR